MQTRSMKKRSSTGTTGTTSQPTIPSDEELCAAFEEFRKNYEYGQEQSGLLYPPDNPVVYLKFIYDESEPKMQEYAYNQLQALPPEERGDIRIPRVIKYFDFNVIGMNFLAVEYIQGKTVKELLSDKGGQGPDPKLRERLLHLISKAMSLFLKFPIPQEITGPGRLGDGQISHVMYPDGLCYLKYQNVTALQEHYNRILTMAHFRNVRPSPDQLLNFADEPMCFCYSDLHVGNFIYPDTGQLYVLDFGHTSFLPVSFFDYAFAQFHYNLGDKAGKGLDPDLVVRTNSPQVKLMSDVDFSLRQFQRRVELPPGVIDT